MSRETEKTMKEISKFLEQNADENMSMDDMNELIQQFMGQYNSGMPIELTEENAETSDDYYELAENADTKKQALIYVEKALELDADNIDARVMFEKITTKHPSELFEKFEKLIDYGKEVMKRKGYENKESIGDYWGILETRPFIRMYSNYLDLLVAGGMMRKAIAVGEDIIRYNEGDNMGIRYRLMHLYAYLEEEKCALELHHRYEDHDETQMLLPMSILYFKLSDFKKAGTYLRRLNKVNKDTKKFMKAVLNDSLEQYSSCIDDIVYKPYTIEEFVMESYEHGFLFETVPLYFEWAERELKKKSK